MAFLLHYKWFIMRNFIVFFTSVLLVLFTGVSGFAQSCTNTSVSSFQPASGPENTVITINGSGFQFGSGVSAVQFGTTPAIFTIVSDTQVTATVPAAATSGNITLIANGGCLATSPATFTVLSSNCSSPEIYISEIYDAFSGSPGAIELYNPTNATIIFNGQYVLERYGNTTDLNPTNGYTLILTGSIAANSTYLVRSGPAPCNLTINPVMGSGINEDDAIKLRKDGLVIDVVNAPDEKGYTVIRNANAAAPSGTAFVGSQWATNSQESCTNLGMHTANPPVITVPGVLEPESTTVCQNGEAVFSTGVSGSGYSYQWKMLNTSGNWTNITNGGNYSGATSDTFIISNTPFSLNNSQFYCQITSSTCILVTDAAQLTVTVIPAPTVTAIQPTCTITTGSITVTAPTGNGYTYSIDGINYQTSPTFTTLIPNTYSITVQDSNGCISLGTSQTLNAPATAPAAPTVTAVQPTCTTATGSITITSPTGTGLTYSIDGDAYQASPIFNSLPPDTYSITVENADGCISTATSQVINAAPPTPAAPTVTAVQPTCTTATGSITVTAPTDAGITYSIDGITYQTLATFNGLAPATYPVTVKNADGCISTATSQVINAAPPTPAAPTVTVVQPTCTTATGSITVTAPTGTGTTYSIDGITYQTLATFNGLVPGTYPVTVQNAQGCISTATSQVINTAPATPAAPTVTAVQPTCTTATGSIAVTVPSGNGLTYSIDGDIYQISPSFTNLPPDTYSITIQNAEGCISTATSQVINTPPAPTVAPTVTAVQPTCTTATGSITVTAPTDAGTTYSIDGITYQTLATFNNLAPGTYPVIVKNADGCISSATSQIINAEPATPAAPALTAIQPTCTTPTGTITVTVTNAGNTYSIDGVTYQASATFSGLAPNATYTITVKNISGCISTPTSQIINTIPTAPDVPTVSAIQPTCTTSGSITVTPPAGTGFTYSINGVNYQSSVTFNNVAPGTYPVTVKNAAGCISAPTSQTINTAPAVPVNPVLAAIQPTCAVPSGSITVTSPSTGVTYSVDGFTYQASATFSNLAPGTYTITVKNTSGCTASATKVINAVPTAPAAPTVTNVQPTCTVATGSITVTVPTGNGLTYSIDGTTYQNATTFSNLAPGTYSITVKNASGCISAATTQIINAAPAAPATPTLTATQPTCTTATGSITVATPIGLDLTYSIDGINYQATTTFNDLPQGNYIVTVKNTAGCTASATQIINAAPTTPAVPVTDVVQPTCAVPTGKITVTSPVSTFVTYSLDGITYQNSPVFAGLGGGTYTITVKNTAGCTSVSAPISVDAPPAPAPDPGIITGDSVVCADGTLQLANTTTGGVWASSNINIATVDATGLVTAITSGTVNITYTVGTLCTADATKTITIQPLPRPALADAYYICVDNETGEATPIVLNSGLSEALYTFTWSKDGDFLTDTTSSIITDEPGEYTVTATNTITGCIGSDTTTVTTSSLAIASAEVGQDFSASQAITIKVTGGSGDYEYSVDGGPFQDEPYFTGITSGEHSILVRDKNGCGTIELEVFALNYPHYFSANHDGTQDTWNIKGLSSQYNAIIYIYDRYGKLITSVRPGAAGWDGTYNGYTLPATDYWFKILYRSPAGINKEFKAHFALIR